MVVPPALPMTLQVDADDWCCPMCQCPGELVPEAKREKLRNEGLCTRKESGLCNGWCEATATQLHCHLCVRWFKKKREAV